MKVILSALFLAGLATALVIPLAEQARATAVWSDFMAFETRVQSDPHGERILDYGGENEDENFSALLDRLYALADPSPARGIGFSIAALAAVGMFMEFRRTKG